MDMPMTITEEMLSDLEAATAHMDAIGQSPPGVQFSVMILSAIFLQLGANKSLHANDAVPLEKIFKSGLVVANAMIAEGVLSFEESDDDTDIAVYGNTNTLH
jgi:hypothetical protein